MIGPSAGDMVHWIADRFADGANPDPYKPTGLPDIDDDHLRREPYLTLTSGTDNRPDLAGSVMELPKIISVDDHVVEPAHVWQTWLPQKYREQRPARSSASGGARSRTSPAPSTSTPRTPNGLWGDAWYFEDRLIYVHKRFVAIPLEATPDGDLSKFDRTKMVMEALTYDEMRPGCYDRDERIKDFERNWVDGSLPFPTFPRFCGQTFYEADDKDLGARVRQGVQRLDGRGVVRPVEGHEHPALPHAAVGRRARRRGDPAQRGARACARSVSVSSPTT